MHEWDVVHHRPADADDHDGSTPANRVAGGTNTALHSRTLDDGGRHRVLVLTVEFPNLPCSLLGAQFGINLVRLAARHELLRELQPFGNHIGDNQRVRS